MILNQEERKMKIETTELVNAIQSYIELITMGEVNAAKAIKNAIVTTATIGKGEAIVWTTRRNEL
jgi:hypothetical protein